MQVHCNEGVAIDPESWAIRREETGNFCGVKQGLLGSSSPVSIVLRQSDGGGMIEGRNEFDDTCRKEVRIDKSWESLFDSTSACR